MIAFWIFIAIEWIIEWTLYIVHICILCISLFKEEGSSHEPRVPSRVSPVVFSQKWQPLSWKFLTLFAKVLFSLAKKYLKTPRSFQNLYWSEWDSFSRFLLFSIKHPPSARDILYITRSFRIWKGEMRIGGVKGETDGKKEVDGWREGWRWAVWRDRWRNRLSE